MEEKENMEFEIRVVERITRVNTFTVEVEDEDEARRIQV